MRDLGGLRGGGDTEATAINGQGDIVGWSTTTENTRHVVLWPRGGKIRDLGRPLGSEPSRSIGALMINDRRQIAGSAVTETQGPTGTVSTSYGFLWQNGKMRLLASPSRQTRVYDLNEKGQIVGSWRTSAGKWRAFLWQNGKLTDLGLLPDLPSIGISDAGTPFPGGPPDLEEATSINDRGQIVGYGMVLSGSDCPHGFLWQQGHLRDLGTLSGATGCTRPAAINNRGQVVGLSTNPDGIEHPFVWQNGKLSELPSLGGERGAAVAINARGQIVGSSTTRGTSQRAVLWSQTNSD